MKKTSLLLLEEICAKEEGFSLNTLSTKLGLNVQQLRYSVNFINRFLPANLVIIKESKGKFSCFSKKIKKFVLNNSAFQSFLFIAYRQDIMILHLAFTGLLNLNALTLQGQIARTTLQNELEEIKLLLKNNHLSLERASSKGLKLQGNEYYVRLFQRNYLKTYQELPKYGLKKAFLEGLFYSNYKNTPYDHEVEALLHTLQQKLQIKVVQPMLLQIYFKVVTTRLEQGYYLQAEVFTSHHNIFCIIKEELAQQPHLKKLNWIKDEISHLTTYFLSCTNYYRTAYQFNYHLWVYVYTMIEEVSNFYNVNLKTDNHLFHKLLQHLGLAIKHSHLGICNELSIPFAELESLLTLINPTIANLETFFKSPFTKTEKLLVASHFYEAIECSKNPPKVSLAQLITTIKAHTTIHNPIALQQELLQQMPNHFINDLTNPFWSCRVASDL